MSLPECLTDLCGCGRCRPLCLSNAMHKTINIILEIVNRSPCADHHVEYPDCSCGGISKEISELADEIVALEEKWE